MKNLNWGRIFRRVFSFGIAVALLITMLWNRAFCVHAYTYATTGASRLGTVTIVPIKGTTSANGYYTLGGYHVTYTIQKDVWTAFNNVPQSSFYVGNNLNASGGCSFAYQNGSGQLYEDGAIQLGSLSDGKLVAEADVIGNRVTCTFTVKSLSELPTYIGYAYHPAPSAYIHLNEERGMTNHIWHYQNLSGTTVSNAAQIDTDAPTLRLEAEPIGETVEANGKTWAGGVNIHAVANDAKSGTGGITVYQNGESVGNYKNLVQSAGFETFHQVTENGVYEALAYDKLNNPSKKITIDINNIDAVAPVIEKIETDESDFCTSNKIKVVSRDDQSGLAERAYSWNGGEWTKSPEFDATENGVYEIKVRDALGNESVESVEINNIDNTPPVIESVKEIGELNGKVKIEVKARDNEGGCGLHQSPYSFDGGKTWQSLPCCYAEKNGVYRICVRDALEAKAESEFEVTSMKNADDILPTVPQRPDEPVIPEIPTTPGIPNAPDEPVTYEIPDQSETNTEDVSANSLLHLPRLERKSQKVQMDKNMSEPQIEVPGTILNMKPVQQRSVPKIALAVLIGAFVMGLFGLGLYLWLFYLQRSCILYGVDDKQERIRICRLPIRLYDEEWQVKVPEDRLGDHGTGKYVLVFHPSFVKEEMPASVIIVIAERSIREILDQEVSFCI